MIVGKGAMLFIRLRTVFLFWLLMQHSSSVVLDSKTTVIVQNGLEGGHDLLFH